MQLLDKLESSWIFDIDFYVMLILTEMFGHLRRKRVNLVFVQS